MRRFSSIFIALIAMLLMARPFVLAQAPWGGTAGPSGAPSCVTLSGATPTLTPSNVTAPVKECFTATLGANTTLTSFASTRIPAHMWVAQLIVTQPAGGHNYTFTFTAGAGVNVVFPNANGCASLPSMPTGTGHSLMLDMVFNNNPATPELDVVSCPTTGS